MASESNILNKAEFNPKIKSYILLVVFFIYQYYSYSYFNYLASRT